MDYRKELDGIEKIVNESKTKKITLKERKRKSEEELAQILEELKKEEITEKELEIEIEELEITIEEEINKCLQILEK